MAILNTADIPDDVQQQLEERARLHGRSVTDELREMLETATHQETISEAQLLDEIREARRRHSDLFVTESELQRLKRWGRE
jgi:plasmid stability protein